jgi:CheY-like chemotaxis protein
MADILVVEANEELAQALLGACRRAGLQADHVGDGAEALSSLDWHPPRGLVSAASLPDMPGWELCTVVRDDPKTRGLPFILLVDPADESREEVGRCGATLIVPRSGSVHMVPTLLRGLIGDRRQSTSVESHPSAESTLSGTFSVLGVPDLVQTIALGRQPGQLRVTVRGVRGILQFHDGRVIDAEFGSVRGEAAVADLIEQTESRQGSFVFVPDAGPEPRPSIHKNVSQLLLDIAAELDHRRADLSAAARHTSRA